MATVHGDLILTGDGDRADDRVVQRRAAEGKLRKIADRIYAENNGRDLAEIVCGKWAPILAHYAPGAVLHGRSAIRKGPWRDKGNDGRVSFPGWIYATSTDASDRRRFSLPGLELRVLPGVGPLEGDLPYLGVHLASDARALLENLQPSRSRQGPSRTIGQAGVERAVEEFLDRMQQDGLRDLRAHAERIAPALGAQSELAVLKDIIGTVLGTRKAKLVASDVAARRRATAPYDPECMERLKQLATGITRISLPNRPDPHVDADARTCASFIEAYFTNYIEGTRFLVDKARDIVFDQGEPDGRPQDGRDVTQTYAQVMEIAPGIKTATTAAEFIDEIRGRNRLLLDSRPEKRPGEFKQSPNRAGNTVFVDPRLVEGTLREGFEMLKGIQHPFARGLFAHTLVVMVHPFDDGNGRTARLMMTKELVAGGQARAIVPTIFRSDYIGGLRALSGNSPQAAPLVRAMLRCQEITAAIATGSLDATIGLWASTHAFLENERDARLTSPDASIEIVWRKGIPAPSAYWRDLDLEAQMQVDEPSSLLGL